MFDCKMEKEFSAIRQELSTLGQDFKRKAYDIGYLSACVDAMRKEFKELTSIVSRSLARTYVNPKKEEKEDDDEDDNEDDDDEGEGIDKKDYEENNEKMLEIIREHNFQRRRIIELETGLDVLKIVGPRKHCLIKTWDTNYLASKKEANKEGMHLFKTYEDGGVELWTE